MLNIVSELTRAKNFLAEQHTDFFKQSLERVLELMDLTTDSWKEDRSFSWLREFLRCREIVASFYAGSLQDLGDMTVFIRQFLDMEPACHHLNLEI